MRTPSAFERQIFAANGYVVINVNYRGSSGRGAKFSEAIFADWGRLEVDDVLAAVDYAVAQGIADPNRLGHRRLELRRRPHRLRHRQRHPLQGGHQRRRQRQSYFALRTRPVHLTCTTTSSGPPWKNIELWIKYSYPFFKANRITTPTLFMGGQNDFNVPILGSEQMYQALKTLKVPTQLVVYPGQNHGLTKVPFLRDRLERYLAWYGKYLNGDATTSAEQK